ncbi:MAG: SurA N-terminal domain-containing protein [Kiritimatiellia bacterium]
MLISKFNKLIRNKVVWAGFAILVSLSMVGLFAPQPRDGRENRREGFGTLFGESVSRDEFVRARLFVQAFQPMRGGEDVQQLVDEEAWARLAALRYGEQLGIRVLASELVDTIRQDRTFWENGVFSMPRYQFLVEQQIGVPVAWFEEYIRQELLLDRLRDLLGLSLWVPSSELEDNASRFTDTYEVSYVMVTPDEDLAVAAVGEEAARVVYEDSPGMFIVPESRKVIYARFAHAEHIDLEQITMRQIEARYELDSERFVFTDPETDVVLTQPLAEVEDVIRQELAEQEALALSSEKAMALVDELSLVERGQAVSLAALAESMAVPVFTSDWFHVAGPEPEGISAGAAFVQAAFRLSRVDPAQSFSFSVPGTNAVYVLQLDDVREEYLPVFEDVKDAALALARQRAEEAAFTAYVQSVHTRISDGLREGLGFAALAEREGKALTEIKPFTLVDADPRDIPFFADLAPDLLPLQAGELTDAIQTTEGAVIAYLQSRVPGALDERLAIKPDLAQMMASGVENVHFQTWMQAVLEAARK